MFLVINRKNKKFFIVCHKNIFSFVKLCFVTDWDVFRCLLSCFQAAIVPGDRERYRCPFFLESLSYAFSKITLSALMSFDLAEASSLLMFCFFSLVFIRRFFTCFMYADEIRLMYAQRKLPSQTDSQKRYNFFVGNERSKWTLWPS